MRTRLFLLALIFSLLAVDANAQFKASLQGTVTDPNGAVVVGATVTVTNKATGISHEAVTSDTGFYRVPELAPGAYTVTVEAPGFKKSVSNDVVVEAEQPRGFDVTLQVGAVQESVTVTAAPSGLQTEDANVSNTISEQQILTLPQYGRDPYELVRLTPGVFGDGARQGNGNALAIPQQVGPGGSNSEIFQTENQVQVVADGQRLSANNFSLDGVSTNSLNWGGASVITPNQESVQEVVTTSSSFSAEDGRNSGAQVKVISKYGTNNFHGSGIIKFNDKGLNAFNKFYGPNNVALSTITCEAGAFTIVASHCPSRNDQKYREFGGSLGGPVYKDKVFFFFSYEGVRLNSSSLVRDVKLETAEFRQYVIQVNPSSLAAKLFSTPGIAPRIETTTSTKDCCSLITNPSDPNFHPVGMWYQPGPGVGNATGNGPDGIPDWGIFDLRVPSSSSGNQFNGRVDYTAGKNQFFFSSYFTHLDNFNGGQRPLEDLTLKPLNSVGTIGWTRTIGSTMVNEARGNLTRWAFDQLQPTGETNYGIPQIRLFDFDVGGLNDAGRMIGIGRSFTTPGKLAQNTFAFRDVLSWMHRNHAFKFGVEITREQNNDNESGGVRPDYQFRGLLNLANDACCFFEEASVNPNTGAGPDGQRYFRTAGYGLFVQDDWKVRSNLTVNLGLRWEYFPPVTETQNRMSNYIFGSQGFLNGSVQVVKQLFQPDKNNLGPRLGFAWSPGRFHGNLALRGGFGVLYERHFGTEFSNIRQNTPFFAEPSTCCFFDPGKIIGPPPGSNILYGLGSNATANSYPANPGFANGVAPDGALCGNPGCTTVTKVDIFAAVPNEPNPYVYAFSYQAQAEPIHNFLVTLGYQGSRSRKLVRTIDLNRFIPGDTFDPCATQPPPSTGCLPGDLRGNRDEVQSASPDLVACGPSNPLCPAPIVVGNNRFNRVFFPLPDVNASFDAMIFQVSRRLTHGFQISSLYSWSHSIDAASYEIGYQQTDPSNQLLNKGRSDFDVRQNWSLSGLWELPYLRSRHDFLGTALGGWTISGILSKHSGFPFAALIGSCDPNNDKNGDGYCPDMPNSYSGGAISGPSKQQWINGIFPNPSAEFNTTTRGPGCHCRNIFTGPGYTSLDFMLGKDFRLPRLSFFGESSKLEFRANFFNALNILNLTPLIPATAPTDIKNTGGFGRPSDGLSGRVVEFQARFSF